MTAQDDKKQNSGNPAVSLTSVSHGKEGEAALVKTEIPVDVTKEVELSKEVRDAGVEKIHGTIELPPDVKKLGVSHSGAQSPVGSSGVTVTLPISDDKIITAQNAPVNSSIKWLAAWCIRKLKLAHLVLKNIHGKIVRVKIKGTTVN